jgi:hypothetical protein
MHYFLMGYVVHDAYSDAAFEDTRKLIEPAHLASGEPSGSRGYELFCLLE